MKNFDKFLDSKRALKEMFREFDRDGNGFINKEEAKNVVEKLLPDVPDDEENSLFTKEEMGEFWMDFNDFDKDGVINYEEFLIWYETSRMNGVIR